MFYVSRQSYIYDDGAFAVEIATELDFMSPGALSDPIESHDDPRDAARAAITLAETWRAAVGEQQLPLACFTVAANSLVYPTAADAKDATELLAWAEQRYAASTVPHASPLNTTNQQRDTPRTRAKRSSRI